MPRIFVSKGTNQGEFRILTEGRSTIGRDPVRTVPLLDAKASRLHAEILRVSNGWRLRDLGSTNRTYVNGQPVAEHLLCYGDVIGIGDTELIFQAEASAEPSQTVELAVETAVPGGLTIEMPRADVEGLMDRLPAGQAGPSGRSDRRMRVLWRLSRTAFVKDSLETFLDEVFTLLLGELLADVAVIFLVDDSGSAPRVAVSRTSEALGPRSDLKISSSIVDQVLRDGHPFLVSDTARAAAVSESIRQQRIQSVMCAPLRSPDKNYGAFYVDLRARGVSYQPEDLEFFAAVCAHVAVNVENLMLYHRQLEAFRRLNQAQDQLIASEKMGVLGRLAGAIAHELNNPLQGIMFAATFLSEDLQDSSATLDRGKLLDRVDTVLHSVDRCAQLVRRLLHYSRRDPSVLVPLDVSGPIEQAIQLMNYLVAKRGVAVQSRYPAEIPKILGNAAELEQVFINLIKNASDAITPPGRIDLTVREADGMLEVAVSDSGVGIEPGDLPHIFEELFTTKPPGEGTGLGLPLCKRIVEKHGGDISVVSRPGEGATFTVYFPVWRE